MKRPLRIFLFLACALICVGLFLYEAAVVRSNEALRRIHDAPRRAITVTSDAGALVRGAHVAVVRGCTGCHGGDLAGFVVIDNGAMGKIYGPNLTRGRGGLPAGFSAEDFERAIRRGVDPTGRGLFIMPSEDFAALSKGDMNDLIAYLQSVPPVDRRTPAIEVGPVSRVLLALGKMQLSADKLDHSPETPTVITPSVTADYGRYLATACMGCHGSNMSGGKIAAGSPDWPPAANLTPGPAGRISGWTEADFVRALRTAKRPDGTSLNPVMPRVFGQMSDNEIRALWLYVRTLAPAATGSHA